MTRVEVHAEASEQHKAILTVSGGQCSCGWILVCSTDYKETYRRWINHIVMILSEDTYLENLKLRELLTKFIDQEDCSFDHKGYCQAHAYFDEGECPQSEAKRILHEALTQ